jgi:hypothetical protein
VRQQTDHALAQLTPADQLLLQRATTHRRNVALNLMFKEQLRVQASRLPGYVLRFDKLGVLRPVLAVEIAAEPPTFTLLGAALPPARAGQADEAPAAVVAMVIDS